MPIQDGRSYTEPMDPTKTILDLIPESYEPGATLPNSDSIRSRLSLLDRQCIVVDTLFWVVENKAWLGMCDFALDAQDDYVYVEGGEIAWSNDASSEIIKEGAQKIQDIADDLGSACSDNTNETIKKVVSAMNKIQWDPAKAFQALVPLAPVLTGGPDREHWLGAHLAHFEASRIQENTQDAQVDVQARRPRI
jgi:hypothetical protein